MVQVWLIMVLNRKGVSQKWLWSSSGFIQHIRGRDWHNVTFRYHCGTAQYSMHAISCSIVVTESEQESEFELTKAPLPQYLCLMKELWGMYCEDVGQNWPS